MTNQNQKLSHGIRELTSASVLTKPLGIVNAAILFSCLSIHDFGLLALAQGIFTLVNYFSGFAQGELVVRQYAFARVKGNVTEGDNLFRSFFLLGILGAIGVTGIVFTVLHSFWVGHNGTLTLLIAGALVALFGPFRNIVLVYFQAREDFPRIKVLELSCRFSLTIGYVLLVFGLNLGLLGALTANVIANFTPLLVAGSSFFIETSKAIRHPNFGPILNLIKSNGKWLLARWGITKGQASLRPWLIFTILGTEAVAFFEVAKTVLGICKDVIPIKKVLLPIMSREVIHVTRFKKIFQQTSCYAVWIYVAIGMMIILFAPLIFTTLLPKYQGSINLVQLMAINLILSGFAVPQPSLFFALDKQRAYFVTTLVYFLLELLLGISGMILLGLSGMALAFIANNFVIAWTRYFYLSRQDSRLRLSWKAFFKFDADDKAFFIGLLPRRSRMWVLRT